MSEDLHLNYLGGSGGFYFLHQLLINDDFFIFFPVKNNKNIDYIRCQNFNINLENWKSNEIFPDNEKTKKIKIQKRKLFFTCIDKEVPLNFYGKKILLYTDKNSQIRLSLYKKAYWFKDNTSDKFSFLKKKLLENQRRYVEPLYELFEKVDYIVKFQDLLNVKTLEKIIVDLNCNFTEKNIEFMNYYKSLHPPQLLKKIGVEI